jgi:hypothetical protein
MTTQTDVEGLIRKTRQYEFADGLRDLQLAIILAFLSIFLWFSVSLVGMGWYIRLILILKEIFGNSASWIIVALYLLILFSILGGSLWLMRILRRKWLWRETGWVKPLRWQVPRRVSFLSTVIILGGIGLALTLHIIDKVDATFVLRMIWTATGWAFGYTLSEVGREIGLKRFRWYGIIGVLASTVVLFLPLDFGQTAFVLYGGWALGLGVPGAIILRRSLAKIKQVDHG